MKVIDRYILKYIAIYAVGFAGISLLILLLERMLRLFDLTVNSEGTLGYVAQMLLSLIPHYLEIALPASFFLAILLTIHRLSGSGELTALHSAGVGLQRILGPIMVMAVLLTVLVSSIVAVVQPHSRYSYRQLVHVVAHQSLTAVVREGAFVTKGDLTFMAERRQKRGDQLEKIFVYTEKPDGRVVVTTAPNGALRRTGEGGGAVLALNGGVRTNFMKNGGVSRRFQFESFNWQLNADRDVSFRPRGRDVREMTLFELWQALRDPPAAIPIAKIAAEFNIRLVRAATMLILPLVAIPFGLIAGRTGQSSGIAVGLLTLVVYQKALEFGTSFGGLGLFSPWLGAWLPFLGLTALGVVLFIRAGYRVAEPPLAILTRLLEDLWTRIGRPRASEPER